MDDVTGAVDPVDPDRLTDLLAAAAADPTLHTRFATVFALGDVQKDGVVDALVKALERVDSSAARFLVMSLGWIGSAHAVDVLRRLVDREDPELRAQALFVLGEVGHQAAVGAVTARLSDPDDAVRAAAQFSLAWNQGRDRINGLVSVAEGGDEQAGALARSALSAIGPAVRSAAENASPERRRD